MTLKRKNCQNLVWLFMAHVLETRSILSKITLLQNSLSFQFVKNALHNYKIGRRPFKDNNKLNLSFSSYSYRRNSLFPGKNPREHLRNWKWSSNKDVAVNSITFAIKLSFKSWTLLLLIGLALFMGGLLT